MNEDCKTTQQKCKFCSSFFDDVKDYLFHIEKAHQNDKDVGFMCSECGKQYKTKNELTHHINSKCGTIKQFKCKTCGQELMSAGSLYNHMLRHKGVRSFMCRFCAKLFFTAGQLKVHERIHTQDKAYVCEVCNKGFCHRQSLITHSTLHTGIKPFQCENCGNSFSCVGNLLKHRKTHADTCGLLPLTTHRVKHPSTKIKVKINTPINSKLKIKEKNVEIERELDYLKTELFKQETDIIKDNNSSALTYPINVKNYEIKEGNPRIEEPNPLNKISEDNVSINKSCDEANETIQKKKRKLNRKKNSRYLNYEEVLKETDFEKNGYGNCKYCGKKYTNALWFYKHIEEHEDNIPHELKDKSVAPQYKCSCCKSRFYTKEDNIKHQQTNHADILTCNECEKIFANRDSLRSHQKVFHQGLNRKAYLYICDKCGKQFKQKFCLEAHQEKNCDKVPSYECTVCQRKFSTIYTRNNHMRIHDPDKKLMCKFCFKTFNWKGQLKIHERSHTGEKPFACLYCPKAFAYRESLITHSSLHTGIKPHLCEGCGSRFSCIGNLIKHKKGRTNECGGWTYKSQKQQELGIS